MTFAQLRSQLAKGGIPDPATDAAQLLSHLFGVSHATLLAEPTREYESEALTCALARRLAREPLQHILGKTFFYGEEYEVSADCLIPRADTELLVEYAIRHLPEGACFADLCTGSGCIALSVLSHRPDLSAIAVDISDGALAVARRNAARLSLSDRIRFYQADLLTEALPFSPPAFVLSNPPYITDSAMETLAPELGYEPSIALRGGADGLCFYRRFLSLLSPALFLFEIGYDQKEAIIALGKAAGYATSVFSDFGGNPRLAVLEKPSS